MIEMKCPVCKGELHIFKSSTQDAIVCADCGFDGNTKLWQELICTRKALDVAKDTLHWYNDNYDSVVAQETINEITALEQKDLKC